MDLTVFSRVEGLLAAQGLAMQAGILDQFQGFKVLVTILCVAGMTIMIVKSFLADRVDIGNIALYMVFCLVFWLALIPARADVHFDLGNMPPEQKASVDKRPQDKKKLEDFHSVNLFFAIYVNALDGAARVASNIIAKASSQDGYARVQDSLLTVTTASLARRLEGASKGPAKDAKDDLDMFFNTNAPEEKEKFYGGCRYWWDRAVAFWHRTPGEMHPWVAAVQMMYMQGIPSDNNARMERISNGYKTFKNVMVKYANFKAGKISVNQEDQIRKCAFMPEKIFHDLYLTAQDFAEDDDDTDSPWVEDQPALQSRWATMKPEIREQVARRLAGKTVWQHYATILEKHHYWGSHIGKLIGVTMEKFGVLAGVAKMSYMPAFASWTRGGTKMLLFAFFPFVCLFLFLPSGFKFLGVWMRLVLAVYIWQVLDVLNISMMDSQFWKSAVTTAGQAMGIKLDLEPLVWVQSALITVSPVMAYFLSSIPGAIGIGNAAGPRGLGKVVTFAARTLSKSK